MWSGSVRELELVLDRAMEFTLGRFSAPPECLRVRGTGTDRRGPFAEFVRLRSGSFRADLIGFFVAFELARLRLTLGCGVCVRGGR